MTEAYWKQLFQIHFDFPIPWLSTLKRKRNMLIFFVSRVDILKGLYNSEKLLGSIKIAESLKVHLYTYLTND